MFDGHGAVGKGQINVSGVGQALDSLALGNYPRLCQYGFKEIITAHIYGVC